jgi:hypothetical protein
MLRSILILILFISISGCRQENNLDPDARQLYNEIMEVHDEVMPKMKDIRILKKELKKIENYSSNPEIMQALNNLEQADEAMMDWMAQFKVPKDVEKNDQLNFLNEQMLSVNIMKGKMLNAINKATELSQKLKS